MQSVFTKVGLKAIGKDLVTPEALQWAMDNLDYLNKPMRLLGSSVKVEKGSDKRDTYILYMQPHDKVAKTTLCPMAETGGCAAPCLISSGQLGMSAGQRAATKRTLLFLLDTKGFYETLGSEIDKAERRALKTGTRALFRLNGTSDIDHGDFIASKPHSDFYDYTKILSRVRQNTLGNYHLTFSGSMYSVQSRSALKKAIERGYHIAVAYNSKGAKGDILALPVGSMESLDTTDLRPLDKQQGTLGFLARKGSSVKQRATENTQGNSFFVTAANHGDFIKLTEIA